MVQNIVRVHILNIFRAIRRLISLSIVVFITTFAFVVTFAAVQPFFEPAKFTPANRIVVLGAGMDPDGTLHLSSTVRVEKGVEIYKSGIAPKIHFSGGVGKPDGVSAGEQMAKYAIELGVPAQAISYEVMSQSTLQNALFSAPYLAEDKRIILVTEGFHLARSWASMKLFGSYDIALAHSTPFRRTNPNAKHSGLSMCIREALAIWFNAGRYLVWKAAPIFGTDETMRNNLLH